MRNFWVTNAETVMQNREVPSQCEELGITHRNRGSTAMDYPRIGEALVRGERHRLATAEPELMIGDLNGPVGAAFANLLGGQVEGHTRVLALLNGDVAVKPATLMVSKVTVKKNKYTNILMGSVQAGIAHGVLDAVRDGTIPRDQCDKIGIIAAIWLYPEVVESTDLDFEDLFNTHRKSMHLAIKKAMSGEPTIEWLLENQDKIVHSYHQKGLEGKL
jgi:formaldehyde-activating enzyme